MKKQTRFFSIMMATAMALSLTACGGDSKSASDAEIGRASCRERVCQYV